MSSDALQALLRPTEQLRVFLNATLVEEHPGEDRNAILAIIVHVHPYLSSVNPGAILILKNDPHQGKTHVWRAYPIQPRLTISMTQNQDDHHLGRPRTSTSLIQLVPEFTLDIRSGQDWPVPVRLRTKDMESLQSFLAEAKKLKQNNDESDQEWLAPYTAHHLPSIILSRTAPDLRAHTKPLHYCLSTAFVGALGDDVSDIAIIREDWLRRKIVQSCAGTGPKDRLKLRVGTFNVNGKPPSQDLGSYVQGRVFDSPSSIERTNSAVSLGPDLLVFGFQELDAAPEALVMGQNHLKAEAWLLAMRAALGSRRESYETFTMANLAGLFIVIFVRKEIETRFADGGSCVVGTGTMGLGNKGGVALRVIYTPPGKTMDIRPVTLTFVNSHLAALDEMVDRRNADFRALESKLKFGGPESGVYESDVLIWMGDLNYRIDLPDSDVRALLSVHNLGMLLQYDQLLNARKQKQAFELFSEAEITHLPSYRHSSGIPLDSMGYDTKRQPAWTDRILYAGASNVQVKQLDYARHAEITMSDHRPVSANVELQFDVVSEKLYQDTVRSLHSTVADFEESDEHPKLALNCHALDFGQVTYKKTVTKTITVTNTGKIPSTYRFLARTPETSLYPSWLVVEPLAGLLLPSESHNITFSTAIDKYAAAQLNLGPTTLECTLVLHTSQGKDNFISIVTEYQNTCFASPLDILTRLPGPIRKIKSQNDLLPDGRGRNAPREALRLINWMMEHATHVEGLFVAHANQESVNEIRECLDVGDDLPEPTENEHALALAVGQTLLEFLDALPHPVIPLNLQTQCIAARSREEAFEFMALLPNASANLLISITSFLHYFITQNEETSEPSKGLSRSHELALTFSTLLFRREASIISPIQKRDFLLYFME